MLSNSRTPNAQAQRSAAWMPRGEGTLSFRLHPSALSEAAPRERCSLLLGDGIDRLLPDDEAALRGATHGRNYLIVAHSIKPSLQLLK